jgi:hypothetical protein
MTPTPQELLERANGPTPAWKRKTERIEKKLEAKKAATPAYKKPANGPPPKLDPTSALLRRIEEAAKKAAMAQEAAEKAAAAAPSLADLARRVEALEKSGGQRPTVTYTLRDEETGLIVATLNQPVSSGVANKMIEAAERQVAKKRQAD